MIHRFLALILFAFPALACQSHDGLPDSQCTPGATDPRITQENLQQTVCRAGYSKSVRPPVGVTNRMKRQVMQEYGISDENPSLIEGDHLVPISAGGCPGPGVGCDFHSNFWPEQWASPDGAHDKDKIEWALHRAICSGRITLKDAQERIARDWKHALDGVEP